MLAFDLALGPLWERYTWPLYVYPLINFLIQVFDRLTIFHLIKYMLLSCLFPFFNHYLAVEVDTITFWLLNKPFNASV